MKIPRRTIHLMIGLEGVILAVVLVFSILNPVKKVVADKQDFEYSNPDVIVQSAETETETEQAAEEEVIVPAIQYTEAVKEKVFSMSMEEKVAQMFVTTPEQLTGMHQVNVTGNTTKNAISDIPVGGVVYASQNFQGPVQTASMTEALQEYYMEQFGFSLFLMVAETGGTEHSPLASGCDFTVEKSPEEIGEENNAETAKAAAANIAAYMQDQGLNTNIGIQSYSADEEVNTSMLDAALAAYKEAGIYTATTVYHGAADIICLGDSQPFSDTVQNLRYEKQYQGILLANTIADGQSAVDAILAGADMVYCQNEFKNSYQAVLDAANSGTINEELINEAVMRILTCKGYE